MSNVIEYDKKGLDGEVHVIVPRVKVNKKEKWIKHVHCDGARFHVPSWVGKHDGQAEVHCSEPDCIVNKEGRL
jgi:hypothetical protein